MEVDLHQLELRHRDLRIHDGERRRRLIGSVAEIGQQVPVVVIRDADRLVLIDGYLRVEALRRLHRDTATATTWPVTEIEALVIIATYQRPGGSRSRTRGCSPGCAITA